MLLMTPSEVVMAAFTTSEIASANEVRAVKIDIAQEYFIRPRMGDEFFQQMIDGQHNEFVKLYIKPALAHFVRYALTQELSIKITDKGILVFDSSEIVVGSNEQKNSTLSIQDTTTNDTNTTNSKVVVESQTGKDTFDSEHINSVDRHGTIDTVLSESGRETEKSVKDRSDSVNRTDTIHQDMNATIAKSGSNTKIDGASIDKTDTRKNMRTASPSEIRVLALRALCDANTLLAKAVRYVERNSDMFESYVASRYSDHIFF